MTGLVKKMFTCKKIKKKRKKERKKGDKLKKGKTLEWKSQKRCFPGFLNITHN